MRLMIVGAHPADAVDLAGGTIAQHAGMGDEVIVVTVTDGMDSHSKNDQFSFEIKREEVKEALLHLLFHPRYQFKGLKDEPFIANRENHLGMVESIKMFQPDVLITHHPNEYAHWDHAEVGKMVCRALKGAIKRPGDDKWWVNNVYFFATQFRPETARIGYVPQAPDVLIDITAFIEKKIKAMCCFKSQGHNDEWAMRERMNSFEREMGRADGLSYAEGFISYYPLKMSILPVSTFSGGFYNKDKEEKEDDRWSNGLFRGKGNQGLPNPS